MWFRSVPKDSESSIYVFRFRKELQSFAELLGECGYRRPEIKFFSERPRAEIWIQTTFGFSALIALIRVTGEMGLPLGAIVIAPQLLPNSAKEFLTKVLQGLTVRFELCSLKNMSV